MCSEIWDKTHIREDEVKQETAVLIKETFG